MHRHLLRFPVTALLLLISLPSSSTLLSDPEPAKGPFTVSGPVQGVSLEEIASNLGSLTGVTNAGDGRLFLTLRDGRILIFENGAVRPQPFLDIRGQTTVDAERGLLSAAFHPRYDQTGFFFINYTNIFGDTVVARYHVSGDPNRADPASGRALLTIQQPFANHNGGQIQFGPDGYLYIGMGDGGAAFDPECRAQKANSLLGKMLRIDVDQSVATSPFYGIPASNPFRGPGDPKDEIWASGFRNPWRFSFDRETGDLWIGDVGQNHREEIDFQPATSQGGENYGWKVMEATLCSTTDACPASTPPCNSSGFTPPVLEYDHDSGCSVTGGYVYRGSRAAQLRGAYVFGDFCTGVLWAAFRQGPGFAVRTLNGRAATLTSFGEDASGELYAVTLNGKLIRFSGEAIAGTAETVGLYDPALSRFHLKSANSAAAKTTILRFGPRRSGWLPLAGDWDGDGRTTVGFYDPANATFRLKNSTPGGGSDVILQVDAPSADVLPISGDWDGDGRDTVGLYDVTTGTFHLKSSLSGSGFDLMVDFGAPGAPWTPLAGDWDGNGADSVGLFDPAESVFTLKMSFPGSGPPDIQVQFGPRGRGSLPVAGDYDGDGKDGVGVYDPTSAVFRLKNGLAAGNPDAMFRFGPRRGGWKPLAGALVMERQKPEAR